eukprot:Blabericola_migrator_1__4331@NODE_2330_length_2927_cov_7_248601_g1460_i0_p4_GENE_NODE_2330_length_2927_cov_7_248601_g1460_i0NODE_2330_length_2927_cov_7_248601_g1460_i0_p4_ORF_typecomplete_len105_score8_11DOCK_N/PF16172_5/0_15_NODE_2330_length_2927_cov_7_248601_g1460_i018512165
MTARRFDGFSSIDPCALDLKTISTLTSTLALRIREGEQDKCLRWWAALCDILFKSRQFGRFTSLRNLQFQLDFGVEIHHRASTGRLPSQLLFQMISCFQGLQSL